MFYICLEINDLHYAFRVEEIKMKKINFKKVINLFVIIMEHLAFENKSFKSKQKNTFAQKTVFHREIKKIR